MKWYEWYIDIVKNKYAKFEGRANVGQGQQRRDSKKERQEAFQETKEKRSF